MEDICVCCGEYVPEGTMVCNSCLANPTGVSLDLDSPPYVFNIGGAKFKAEAASVLMENLTKYYILKRSMNPNGLFSGYAIKKYANPGETTEQTTGRLYLELQTAQKIIDSLIEY